MAAFARRENRLRQKHPDVQKYRIDEAARYEAYERNILARNYNAAATPRYLEHFQQAPHKVHMVSSCIEEVTRAVEQIQQKQQQDLEQGVIRGARGGGAGNVRLPGEPSNRDNIKGPSTTKQLFLSDKARAATASDSRSARGGGGGDDLHLPELNAAALVNGGSSSSNTHEFVASPSTSPQQQQHHRSTGGGGFFAEFAEADPTKRFRFKPVQLAEALAETPVHPSPRPPLFSRPSKAQTVVVGGDIRLVGQAAAAGGNNNNNNASQSGSSSARSNSSRQGKRAGTANSNNNSSSSGRGGGSSISAVVARDPKLLAVRVAIEQNSLHTAIEEMRQVQAAMAVKTYNSVNAMRNILAEGERAQAQLDAQVAAQDPTLPLSARTNYHTDYSSHHRDQVRQGRSPSPPPPSSGRSVGSSLSLSSARANHNPTMLSSAIKQQLHRGMGGRRSPPMQVPVRTMVGAAGEKMRMSTPRGSGRGGQQQQQDSLPPRTLLPGRHMEGEEIVSSRPPTREQRTESLSPRRNNNQRVAAATAEQKFNKDAVVVAKVDSKPSTPASPNRPVVAGKKKEKIPANHDDVFVEDAAAAASSAAAAPDAVVVQEATAATAENES